MAMAKGKPWDGKWQKIDSLSGGGQGETILVREYNNEFGDTYVLKALHKNKDLARRKRMYREVQALQKLQHPGLPKIIESNTDELDDINTPLYFVMDYVKGQTLEERVKQDTLNPVEAIHFIIELSDILIYCHKNKFIHRDIKPDNIILRGGNTKDPVLIDFGLTFNIEEIDQSSLTPDWEQLGNRFLHLPELQTEDSLKRYPESDISQVCGLLFFAITGMAPGHLFNQENLKPHERPSVKSMFEEIGLPSLISLFDKGFEHAIDRRFHSFEALKGRLHESLDDLNYSPFLPTPNVKTVILETTKPEVRTVSLQSFQKEISSDEIEKGKENKDLKVEVNYYNGDYSDALTFASLIGAWNEKTEGDNNVIKKLIDGND